TWLPWPVVMKESTDYCRLWFHDVFEENGIPFSRAEIVLMKKLRNIAPDPQG
ncbi:TPA: 1,4-beta-xylanase, partial [Enterobacter hormaechei subsp. hoffmannii]